MIVNCDIADFLELSIPLVDVRTPLEFEQGHICGAYNIPVLSNEDRVKVGTAYKQEGREQAVLLGFDLTGAKWSGFIKQALAVSPDKKIGVYCWRGGMRSGAMAWALNLYGFQVYLLNGGYKRYRNWALGIFNQQYKIMILGGMTGSGKTQVLYELKEMGEQVIDLEDLAQHQGSSYGSMGKQVQPTQEQFENDLAAQLYQVDKTKTLWLEDESITIGKRIIPNPLWHQMRSAEVIKLNVPKKHRINFLVKGYSTLDPQFLIDSTERIGKRLGPKQTRDAVLAIKEGRMGECVETVLLYYDKTYLKGQNNRLPETIHEVDCKNTNAYTNSRKILKYLRKNITSI